MHQYVIVDVFTDTPLEGNQLAVFTDASDLSGERMQRAARETNLSESVFVVGRGDGADARIRIFTPATELPFAGHPVLGTAYVIGSESGADKVTLQTEAGAVPITLTRERGEVVFGQMEQPIPASQPFHQVDELLAAVGVKRSELPVEAYRQGPVHVYVMLSSEAEVAALATELRRAGPARRDRRQLLCRRGHPLQDADVRHRLGGQLRTPPPGPRRGRSRSISPAMAGSHTAPGSRSARARRSGGPRSSMPRSTAARTGWSGCWSGAAR